MSIAKILISAGLVEECPGYETGNKPRKSKARAGFEKKGPDTREIWKNFCLVYEKKFSSRASVHIKRVERESVAGLNVPSYILING